MLDFIKIKNVCSVKRNVKRITRQVTYWKKTFAKDTSEKGLLSKIYKYLLILNNKKTNNQILKWAKELNRHLIKEDIQMASRYTKICSTSYVIMEVQIKTKMRGIPWWSMVGT